MATYKLLDDGNLLSNIFELAFLLSFQNTLDPLPLGDTLHGIGLVALKGIVDQLDLTSGALSDKLHDDVLIDLLLAILGSG